MSFPTLFGILALLLEEPGRRSGQMEETYRDTLLGHFRPEDGIS